MHNKQRSYQHCPQVSGSSSSPGHSQLMAEPLNSGGIQAPENFPSTKGQRSRFVHTPINAHLEVWVGLREGLRTEAAMERPLSGHGAATERPRGGHGAATERPRGGH